MVRVGLSMTVPQPPPRPRVALSTWARSVREPPAVVRAVRGLGEPRLRAPVSSRLVLNRPGVVLGSNPSVLRALPG